MSDLRKIIGELAEIISGENEYSIFKLKRDATADLLWKFAQEIRRMTLED